MHVDKNKVSSIAVNTNINKDTSKDGQNIEPNKVKLLERKDNLKTSAESNLILV